MSKLYDDASLMMIPSSVKDGKLYSVLPQPKPLSSELVTNGTFDEDASWQKDSSWSIGGGKATYDAIEHIRDIRQNVAFQSGKLYKVTFTISDVDEAAGKKAYFALWTVSNGSDQIFNYTNFDNGTYTYYYTPTNGSILMFNALNNGSGGSFSIDNISVVEVDQLPADFTFLRGSNLAATRINKQGLIEKGRENLLTQSNTFSSSDWNNERLVSPIQTGFTGYDGSNNAWKIIPDSTNSTHRISQLDSQTGVKTFSVYLKQAGYSKVRIIGFTGNSNVWEFDLNTGTNILNPTYAIDYKATDVGNGWWRLQLTSDEPHISYYVSVLDNAGNLNFIGNETDGILIQDAQLEVGLVATDYIESGATTGKAGVLEDLPRLNWGDCPSLLLEPSRQNLITHSEYLEGFSWNSTIGSSIDSNVTTSPEGLLNASLLKEDTSNGTHFVYKDFNLTNGGNYTISIFAKSNGENRNFRFADGGVGWSSGFVGDFNLTNGTASGGTIEDYGNGWYRCSVTGTTNATTSRLLLYSTLNTSTSYQGDGSSGVYLYGFQIEEGSYPTSYIPTHGTSVTRSGEFTTLNNRPELFNDEEGVLFYESYYRIPDTEHHITIYNGSAEYIRVRHYTNGVWVFQSKNYNESTTQRNVNDYNKVAIRYGNGSINVFINGSRVTGLDGVYETVEGLKGLNLSAFYSSSFFQGDVRQLGYFPTALSDNECINLTSI